MPDLGFRGSSSFIMDPWLVLSAVFCSLFYFFIVNSTLDTQHGSFIVNTLSDFNAYFPLLTQHSKALNLEVPKL